jgi:hypothetical protein
MKIDVEGTELKVLMGGTAALKSKIKRLVIAAYHYPTEVQDITSYLESVAPRFKVRVFASRKESPEDVFLYAYQNDDENDGIPTSISEDFVLEDRLVLSR